MANNGTIDNAADGGPKGPDTGSKMPTGGILGAVFGALLFFINPFLGLAGAIGGWFGGNALQNNAKSPAAPTDTAGAVLSTAATKANDVAQNVSKSL